METPRISVGQMLADHVVRYADANGSDLAFIDQRIPGHEREIVNILGMHVTENVDDPALAPKLGSAHGFALVFNKAMDGGPSGAALHKHQTEEVFMPIKGTWEVYWLEGTDERAVRLAPLDVINVPIGIYRGFRLVSGEHDALLLAIVGGPDAGRVDWHPSVLDEASKTGLELDDDGNLRETAAG